MQQTSSYRWTICSLIFFATTINYLDRQVISLLKPVLEKEFEWSETDYSNIVASFQLAYAIGMVSVGSVIDKIGSKLGYAISLALWSVVAVLHAFVKSTFGFGVVRALLGFTEAGNFPAAIKVVAEWFPKKERAFATGILNSGTNVGAIVAPLVVPWLAITYSWQMAFIVTGAVGFVWLVFWFYLYDIPSKHKRISPAELEHINSDQDIQPEKSTEQVIPWSSLFRYRQAWAFIMGKFLSDGVWWFFLFWLPAFLISEYGLEGLEISFPVAVVYLMAGFGSIIGGWLPMWFVKKKKWSIVRARKTSMLIYALFPMLIIISQQAGSYSMWYAVIIIGIASSAHQGWSANLFTTVSDLFPKSSIGAVTGIGGMAGALGSILVAKLAGALLDHYRALGTVETGYYILFLWCGFAYLIAWVVMFKFLVPRMTPVSPVYHPNET